MDTENLINDILEVIKETPMSPSDIASELGLHQRDVDYAIQLILERGYAAPNLDWKLALNLNF